MPTDTIVSTNRLTKHFKQVHALNDFSIDVHAGDVVGLLGPNGSGKSTFVRLLLGFLSPTSGTAEIMGMDCESQRTEVHRQVAYLPGDAKLFRAMRGREVIDFFASIRGTEFAARARKIADRFDLDANRWVGFMSTGMRQKLALSIVLAMHSTLLILDEPTANLDPSVRAEVLSLVTEAKADGKTVLFSSHVLGEIEEVCNRVVILRAGQLVYAQPIGTYSNQHQIQFVSNAAVSEPPPELATKISDRIQNEQSTSSFTFAGHLPMLLEWLSSQPIEKLTIQPVSLRSIYDQYHQAED